jgi:hypothetical protein
MEYKQTPELFKNGSPGQRIKELVPTERPDIGQEGGLLESFNPGDRVQGLVGGGADLSGYGDRDFGGGDMMPDVGQSGDLIPDEPGPAAAGRTPLVGSVRRDRDMPVVRDELSDMMG